MSPLDQQERDFDSDINVTSSCLSGPTVVRSEMDTLVNYDESMDDDKMGKMDMDKGVDTNSHGIDHIPDDSTSQPQAAPDVYAEDRQTDEHIPDDEANNNSVLEEEEPQEETSLAEPYEQSQIQHSEQGDFHEDISVAEEHDKSNIESLEDEEPYVLESEANTDATDANHATSPSRRDSAGSASPDRRASGRTEALIHEAASNIVAQIGHGDDQRESLQSYDAPAEDNSFVSHSRGASGRPSDVSFKASDDEHGTSVVHNEIDCDDDDDDWHDDDTHDDSYMSHSQLASARPSDAHSLAEDQHHEDVAQDEGGDSSSHHENDDDVFSDHSPRSSVGSLSDQELKKMGRAVTQRTRSPRFSDMSQYEEDEDFVPTARGTPRPPFRSPSSVKAMQMSSPSPSVLGSPRSSRRSPLPTVSRLASPNFTAQYSPKKTPPRFKRSTPPLVLLHVTLLPLRWPWADVLESARADELSPECKGLRESWRLLHDRMGDTVRERGILLPHPQNDFEVLEERLLEALELPMKRRARILECGHYLGPANETSLGVDTESEDDDELDKDHRLSRSSSRHQERHWCSTCQSDIKFESLGPGKVFRVKVYASNGLMKAGAWEACWKEMERVDVELEPVVDTAVDEELGQLAAEQEHALELHEDLAGEPAEDMQEEETAMEEEEEEAAAEDPVEPESSFAMEQDVCQPHTMPSSPPPEIRVISSPAFDDRRRRDEERLREIYGHTPPLPRPESIRLDEEHRGRHLEPQQPSMEPPTQSPAAEYLSPQTPPSPSVEAFERRQERRQAHKSASLSELLLEAGRVLIQDRRNVAIGLLTALILLLAVKGGPGSGYGYEQAAVFDDAVMRRHEIQTVTVTAAQMAAAEETVSASLMEGTATVVPEASESESSSVDPCVSSGSQVPRHAATEVETVRVMETVTETATVKVTATATEADTESATKTETETETEQVLAVESEPETPQASPSAGSVDEDAGVETGDLLDYDDEKVAVLEDEAAEEDRDEL